MKRYSLILFLSLTAIFKYSYASPTGSEIFKACSAAINKADGIKLSSQESINALWCVGYVSGYLDAHAISSNIEEMGIPPLCLPSGGIDGERAIRVLVKWIKENPEYLHQSGRTIVYGALLQSFPCTK